EDRPLWRDYALLFLPKLDSDRHHPARIIEQALQLVESLDDVGLSVPPPTLQCFALRSDNAKVFEWWSESFPFATHLSEDAGRSAAIERALAKSDEVEGVLRKNLKKLYPRGGKGNRKALDGLIQQALEGYWS